jgi:DNA-binding NarL/FixJ family response regulator
VSLPETRHDRRGYSGGPSLSRARIVLADDHLQLLEAATALLEPHFDVVGTVTDGAMLVAEVLRLHPDVVVTDITMPVLSGIDAIQRLKESDFLPKFVILTIHSEKEFLNVCISEGVLGYVVKSRMKAHLVPAIQAALIGESYISPFGFL